MSHESNIQAIKSLLNDSYERKETRGVPKRSDLTFGNTLTRMPHAVVMYVDMRGSRKLLSKTTAFVSVKAHRSFLQAIVYCVEGRDGHFRSFNGDGALSFFVGENAASRAVRAAMDLKAYVRQINALLAKKHGVKIDFGVGIGQGKVDVAKSGKRGDDTTKQDLVWVGIPVYVAVALSDLAGEPSHIWISPHVRKSIGKEGYKPDVVHHNEKSMWKRTTTQLKSAGKYDVRHTTFFSGIF